MTFTGRWRQVSRLSNRAFLITCSPFIDYDGLFFVGALIVRVKACFNYDDKQKRKEDVRLYN